MDTTRTTTTVTTTTTTVGPYTATTTTTTTTTGYGTWISAERRLAIYLRDGVACAYCGRDLRGAAPAEVTLDHLTPRRDSIAAGGRPDNTNVNLVTACRRCNCSRGAKPWRDYATGGAIDRIDALRVSPVNLDLARALVNGTAGDAAVEDVR